MTRAPHTGLAIAAAILALAGAGTALAAIGLTETPAGATTPTVTLNGDDQESTFTEALAVSGATASGWKITAWAAQPAATGGKTLPALEVTSTPSADACIGKNCVQPSPTGITWPLNLGTTSGSATKIYNAAANTGTGSVTVHTTFDVDVPANALPGAYTTTITFAITNAGP